MVRILALVLLASFALASGALAQCPANYAGLFLSSPSGTPITVNARRDSSCINPTFCIWRSSWDNALGTAHVDVHDFGCPGENGSSTDYGQYTSDNFALTGPSGSNPVSFQALLYVAGSASSGCHTFCDPFAGCHTTCVPGSVQASLSDGTQTTNSAPAVNVNTVLQLTLSKLVGQTFHLDRSLYAHTFCGSASSISSTLQFILPSGYGVVSCYGYAQSGPTATLHASWGKLKTMYR